MNDESRLEQIPGIQLPERESPAAARDLELIRELLMEIERPGSRRLHNWSDEQIRMHLRLLVEAGLISAQVYGDGEECPDVVAIGFMTWAGHDFLAAVRQDTVWRKVRAHVVSTGNGVAFEVIVKLAIAALVAQGVC